jgi:adenine-specific DNA-methyltransferase
MDRMDNKIASAFNPTAEAILYVGSCLDFIKTVPDSSIQLVVTSPPYNIGKAYEKRINLEEYINQQEIVIRESFRILKDTGSICWQTGNFIKNSEIIPLDVALFPIFSKLGMRLRNRIIWHFEHGLHCTKRFSGRYETILWFTKTDNYIFNLDPIRIPQKYPSKKYFKGPNAGQLSCNPLGKNPGDVWIIPNVKNNHVEKTIHPCQFPVELIERLVLSMTNEGDFVLDPFVGVGTSIIAAILHNRKGVGSEIKQEYVEIAKNRINLAFTRRLKTRPMNQPIYDPKNPQEYLRNKIEIDNEAQPYLFEIDNKAQGL